MSSDNITEDELVHLERHGGLHRDNGDRPELLECYLSKDFVRRMIAVIRDRNKLVNQFPIGVRDDKEISEAKRK